MTTKGTDVQRLEGWTARYEGRDRVELPEVTSRMDVAVSEGQGSTTPDIAGRFPGSEHGDEPGKGTQASDKPGQLRPDQEGPLPFSED